MIRTQIQLDEEQAAGAKRLATERGVSMAEVIRHALARELRERRGGDDRWARALAVAGKFRDIEGKTDLSENHDEYLAQIYEEDLHDDVR